MAEALQIGDQIIPVPPEVEAAGREAIAAWAAQHLPPAPAPDPAPEE